MNSFILRCRGTVRRFLVAVLTICLIVQQSTVRAQSQPKTDEFHQIAHDLSVPPTGFGFSLIWNSRHGAFTYVPEKRGTLFLKLENASDTVRNLLCSTYFDEQSTLQFARQVWLPAHSRLTVSHPVLVPKLDPSKGRTATAHSLVIDSSSGSEVLVRNESGQLLHETSLLVTHASRNTAILIGTKADGHVSKDVMDLVIACRVSQKLNNKVAVLSDPYLPTDENCLNYLDQIVIADESVVDDFTTIATLRRWMNAGGHLWVILDLANSIVLERLLGDDYSGRTVDRVGLTSVQIDELSTSASSDAQDSESIDYDDPVEMVRVAKGNLKVEYMVDGWPAALSKTCGEGRLLVTTVGARGWMQSGQFEFVDRNDPQFVTEYTPRLPMRTLAEDFFRIRAENAIGPREKDTQVGTVLESISQDYIGYSVPSWDLVVGTLSCFTTALVLTGIWLIRIQRLEHLGWIGSTLAVVFGLLLIGIGRSYRQSVPATVARVQLSRAIKGTDDVRSEGVIAVYHPEGSQSSIKTTRGGQLWPDMTGLEGVSRRMVTTDFDQSYWQNVSQPAGLRMSTFARSASNPKRLEVRTTLDSKGLIGTWPEQIDSGSDALVVTQIGRIGVKQQKEKSFVASADDVFESGQYLDASFMGEEQVRRRRILEKLLSDKTRKGYREEPQLVVWSDRSEQGFQFGDDLRQGGTSLLSIPMVIERPSNGTSILIPSPLLVYRTRSNPDGSPPSPMWNNARGEWQERSSAGLNWLSVQIPQELLPVTAVKANVQVKVTGPVGRFELMGLRQGQVASLNSVVDPIGTLSFDITDSEALSVSSDGTISLGIRAGHSSGSEPTGATAAAPGSNGTAVKTGSDSKANYWKIESLAVQLWAETIEPMARSNE